ncbi:MAG TPA: hypothetical protein VEH05_09220 [Streptosporangiaceae bacterium]|nr:hypothetical protein [Streptosporangiaceae bacterium]
MNNKNARVAANTCHACCYLAMLDAADEVITDYADIHEQLAVGRGTIEIDRRCADRVREHLPCEGPVRNDNGHLTCPLVELINAAIAVAACRPRTASFAVPPEKVVNSGSDQSPGQFL